ncbi:MAG: M48 family metallopeptidase [Candidatus Ratteibacteria bacterium]|nr:M48 family metallopeptidase [Candidatus Ratteibacteria bacterium]
MEVKISRSSKRRKTIGARFVEDTMYINAPADISEVRLEKVINNFKKRFERRTLKKELNAKEDLRDIAERLNERYFGGRLKIKGIEYVTDQHKKFGCCNYEARTIRISHRLLEMPPWVRDYVVFHEMAHIIEPNHSRAFWKIVSRYRLAERARGYLMAKGLETDFL